MEYVEDQRSGLSTQRFLNVFNPLNRNNGSSTRAQVLNDTSKVMPPIHGFFYLEQQIFMAKLFNWGAYCQYGYFIILVCDQFLNFLTIKEFIVIIVNKHTLEIPALFSK